jgi:4-amino-4-deoxy-L-arabinose transferase-like glycosyltransferase
MTDHLPQLQRPDRPAPLAIGALVALGLGLRVLAAFGVERIVANRPTAAQRLCLFPDASIYWLLARAVRTGSPYVVTQWSVPHYALRTPGYPLFLALCQSLFGENPLAIRLVQAAVGAGCVWLTYRLVARVVGGPDARFVAPLSAGMVALDPYAATLSVLILSESIFIPLMLLTLWGASVLWPAPGEVGDGRKRSGLAVATGTALGSALLVRPSWALFIPVLLAVWLLAGSRPASATWRSAVLVCVGASAIMAPWWVRNLQIYGRFVPTALWVGPSLYDGLNPKATGASDMAFLDLPSIRVLGERELDSELTARASAFARENPGKALRLAVVKSARFWSPWPNADQVRSPLAAVAGAMATLPVYFLLVVGIWSRRCDPRALVLLGGTLLTFWLLHSVFVGSVRYRIPGMIPALGLAAVGARALWLVGSKGRERDLQSGGLVTEPNMSL